MNKTHLIIPDTQIRPEDNLDFISCIGQYIVHKQPDVVVMLGDWADMHSLSSYDAGRLSGEGARYVDDIDAANDAILVLMDPIFRYNIKQKEARKKQYRPRMIALMGNHENRINRHVNAYPVLKGHLSTNDIQWAQNGWEVYDFLEPVVVDGIKYSHYFPRGPNGRITQSYRGAPTARAQVQREGMSCTAGHLQGLDWAPVPNGEGIIFGMIAGSCYEHEEDYLTLQGTEYWRGVILKNEVNGSGYYDPCMVSLKYLKETYG